MRTNRLLFAVPILAFGMASCSNDDSPVNPGQAEVVKTQFSITLNDKNVHTRQSAVIVQGQATPGFRGMENIVLTPFATEISGGATRLGENIVLGTTGANPVITAANTITSLNGGSNSQLYKDVAIPLGTSHFLFYGVAKASGTDQKVNGDLSTSGLTGNNPSGINFNLVSIYNYTDGEIKSNAKVVGLTGFLNHIVDANYNNSGTLVYWKDLDATDPLKSLFTEFTTMHAGASSNILALAQDLYDALDGNTTPMAEAIRTAIGEATFGSGKKCVSISGSTLTLHTDLQGWPGNVNLPDGSVYVTYESSSNSFSIVPAKNNLGMNTPKIQDYTYPASLYYRAKTPIKVHNASLAGEYGEDQSWTSLLDNYTGGAAVGLATRSIALVNPINYAVARLDVKAKANQENLQDYIGNDVAVEITTFPVTGVLIGGQKQVDWEFKPVGGTAEKTIYDSQLAKSFTLPSSSTYPEAFNHTLVLETAPDADIHVALEFLNNSGKAFRGNNGDLIPNGCKFYLVGKLEVDNTKKVFEQDKITTASFNIKSLKGAYNVVPDLRLPALELGLSVNLEWSAGESFDVNIE